MNGHVLTFPIDLCVYDLSTKIISPNGDPLENLWYTSIIAFGREYAYSFAGIECCQPRSTIYGEPKRIQHMGDTEIPYSIFFDFVLTLSENAYRPMSYEIRGHNSTKFCDDVLQFTCGVRIPKYLLELPQDDIFTQSLEELVLPLLKKVGGCNEAAGSSPLDLLLSSGEAKNQHVLLNYIPKASSRKAREPSPDLIEIQAQIEAIREDRKNLKERRSKLRHSVSPSSDKLSSLASKLEVSTCNNNNSSSSNQRSKRTPSMSPPLLEARKPQHRKPHQRQRQKSPHPRKNRKSSSTERDSGTSNCQQCVKIPAKEDDEDEANSKSRRSTSRKPSLKKRVSFDETPVEISRESSQVPVDQMPNGHHHLHHTEEDDECEVDMLPELQEDDLFSTYDSLKAHASPSPPPLLWTDLSKEEKKSLAAAKMLPPEKEVVEEKRVQNGVGASEAEKEPKPITFRELDHMGDFEEFVRDIIDLLTHEEQNRLYEMEMWIMNGEGVWVLEDNFIAFLGRILQDSQTFSSDNRVTLLRLLAYGATQEDFSMILHLDRKSHVIMNYAKEFDKLPILEQEALALMFANLFESCSEWLLYISEWTQSSTNLSNVKVTTKVAVSSLLGETSSLQDYGSAIIHNFSTKEVKSVVFDDVYTELTMAVLQFFQGKPSEEKVFRCLKALVKFCSLSRREVPQLVKMIGPDPSKFTGMSSRVDELIEEVYAHMSRIE